MTSVATHIPYIASGLLVTIGVTAGAAAIAILLAVLAGAARRAQQRELRLVAGLYIELFRGLPAIVQLFWLYYVLPLLGINLPAFAVALVGLGLCFGAYGADVVRGALDGIPAGQFDAAKALGLHDWQVLRLVVFTQALRVILPQFGNLLVDLLKSSALVSLVTLHDLTFSAQNVMLETRQTTIVFAIVIVSYYALARGLSAGVRRAERRLDWPVARA